MNSRQIRLTAATCLLLAGALIYGLNLTKPEIARDVPAPSSGGSPRSASSPSPFSNILAAGPRSRRPAETTHPIGDPSVAKRDVAPPRSTPRPMARTGPGAATPRRIGQPDRDALGTTLDEPLDQAVANVPAAQPPVGLRLAPDVRLPVAAMPHDLKITPIAQQALEQIVVDYYRDLAAGLKSHPSGDSADAIPAPIIAEPGTGELTQIVTNGPATDAARERADYRFKALFGNAAYNRLTMKAVLEAHLSVTATD